MELKRKITYFAITSRFCVVILQFVFNILCPDHEADAFVGPKDYRQQSTIFDKMVETFLGGLARWDAQYFMHIAKFGYTYENTLAFYPFFPMLLRFVSLFSKIFLFFLNMDSCLIVAGIVINFYCFVKASNILYDLTLLATNNSYWAYKSAILFCLNPASIFFSALYTESLFVYLTFYTMLVSLQNNFFVFLPLSLSMITRSNGITNIGFPLFLSLQHFLKIHFSSPRKYAFLINFFSLFRIFLLLLLSFFPLLLLQVYNYMEFCKLESNETTLPVHVVHYAIENKLLLGKSRNHPPWCNYPIPISYSYVQNKYWNVGFFKYYEIKQIPNFLLALPILFIMFKLTFDFFNDHKNTKIISFFLSENTAHKYPVQMFPFIIHGLFLTLFSMFFMHIQVSTRMIFSASPLPYWFSASFFMLQPKDNHWQENSSSEWLKAFFLTRKNFNASQNALLYYFLGYFVIGCFMYSNFLPWT